jgi:hypothetical protein
MDGRRFDVNGKKEFDGLAPFFRPLFMNSDFGTSPGQAALLRAHGRNNNARKISRTPVE